MLVATLGGCGSGVHISESAISEFRVATRLHVPTEIELSGDDISLIARRANVSEGVVKDLAPELETEPVWKSSTTRLQEAFGRVPAEIRSGSIDIACQAIQGEIESEQDLADALNEKFGSVSDSEAKQIVDSLVGYYQDMSSALERGDSDAAAVILTCFIAEQAQE